MNLKKIFMGKSIIFSVIFLVAFISVYKILYFYFWHDDFSWFYLLRNNSCFSFWPYNTFCFFLKIFYQFFGYQSLPYHLAAILLLFLTSLAFFFFCRKFFGAITSVLLASLFSTVFIGSGAFLEVHSPLLVLTPLFLLLVSLILFSRSSAGKFGPVSFLIAVVIFGTSVLIAPIRSSTHILPVVAFIFLFFEKTSVKKKLILSLIVFAVYYFSFFVFPFGAERRFLSSNETLPTLSSLNITSEINDFLATFGSFILTDEIYRLFLAKLVFLKIDLIRRFLSVLVLGFVTIFVFKKRNMRFGKIGIFALIWIASFYFPYGIRSNGRFPSDHRYLLSLFPGVILALAIFSNYKYWKKIIAFLILVGILQTNSFLGRHLDQSKKMSSFYSQLHNLLASFPKNSALFIDSNLKVRNDTVDYFRVGYFPSEASIGSEYGMKYEDLKLFVDSEDLRNYLDEENKTNNFFTYYFDGEKLFDTTKESKSLLAFKKIWLIDKMQKTKYHFDQKNEQWSGTNEDISFDVPGFQSSLPSIATFKIRASLPDVALPYTQDCVNCVYDPILTNKSFDYLLESRLIKGHFRVEVSNFGENTKSEALIDEESKIYWFADRQKWFAGVKPVITLTSESLERVGGVVILSDFQGRKPKDFIVNVNGERAEYSLKNVDESKVAIFLRKPGNVREISIEIISTAGGDAPGIREIDFIPSGFIDLDLDFVYRKALSPASILKTKNDFDVLANYLHNGTSACLKWSIKNYGSGSENIKFLYVDGRVHNYEVRLPAFGTQMPNFSLGCLNYPVELKLLLVGFEFGK